MANADLDKQPDSVSSVLKVFGILQALGEEREIGITELSQRHDVKKHRLSLFTDHENFRLCGAGRGVGEIFADPEIVRTGRSRVAKRRFNS